MVENRNFLPKKMDSDSDSNSAQCTQETPNIQWLEELPTLSQKKYNLTYTRFMDWAKLQNVNSTITESVLITYFREISKTLKPSTLWSTYSMLKSTLSIKQDVDMTHHTKLRAFLKRKSNGYVAKRSKTLTSDEINKFINDAPDYLHLSTKVALVLGICGSCKRDELKNLTMDDIQDVGTAILVKIPTPKKKVPRKFIVTGHFYNIYKKYADLRPPDITEHNQFFTHYQGGKRTRLPTGINKFGSMAKQIATYLNLPDPENYTGHCFRRSSATFIEEAGTITTVTSSSMEDRIIDIPIPNSTSNKMKEPRLEKYSENSRYGCSSSKRAARNEESSSRSVKQCRTCLSTLSYHPRNLRHGLYKNLLEILQCVLELKIEDQTFEICENCETSLNSVIEFKNVCFKSMQSFVNLQCHDPEEKEESMELIESDLDDSQDCNDLENIFIKEEPNISEFETQLTNNSIDNTVTDEGDNLPTKSVSQLSDQSVVCSETEKLTFQPSDKSLNVNDEVLQAILDFKIARNSTKLRFCVICEYVATSAEGLEKHMTRSKSHSTKPWCSNCNLQVDDLKEHREAEKCSYFFCKFCNLTCSPLDGAVRHFRTHCVLSDVPSTSNEIIEHVDLDNISTNFNLENNLIPNEVPKNDQTNN